MKVLQIRAAKAQFSGVVAEAERGQPTIITRHGEPAAMVVPVKDGQRLYASPKMSFADYLLGMPTEGTPVSRNQGPLRAVDL